MHIKLDKKSCMHMSDLASLSHAAAVSIVASMVELQRIVAKG